ncbi:hypothetical protein [Streptomyces lavendulae]|nr:hypothetical protein [Streptomyces lavendulae]
MSAPTGLAWAGAAAMVMTAVIDARVSVAVVVKRTQPWGLKSPYGALMSP